MHPLTARLRSTRFHSLGEHYFEVFQPQGLRNPEVIEIDDDTASSLGVPTDDLAGEELVSMFSGNRVPPQCTPIAQDYAGHQFGSFNPFLGDGRAVILGDVDTDEGIMEISLKGIGSTPYGRDHDGKAGVSECVLEFSTAKRLRELAVPTARCLCVVAGEELVYRGGFERTAVLVRVSPTHVRIGTFENYYFQRDSEALQRLADYVIQHHFGQNQQSGSISCAAFFERVVTQSAELFAHWQANGFVHGMLNTDNHLVLGISFDLGESGFTLEREPDFVANSADEQGRYAFGQQPVIGLWNLNVLGRALSPLVDAADIRAALSQYESAYLDHLSVLESDRA
ncbi:MAG: protein adenylyltransferase SelO family protein [Pseudomonadota bacterium]